MFCEKCGSQIPEGTNVCPNCAAVNNPTPAPAPAPAPAPEQVVYQQAPQQAAPQQVYQQPVYQQAAPVANGEKRTRTIGLICGIVSIVLATVGGMMFGLACPLIAVVIGTVGLILGINNKKNTGEGTSVFVCGLVGLICGLVFSAGCGVCAGVSSYASCGGLNPFSGNVGCYGCVGNSCVKANKEKQFKKDLENGINAFEDEVNSEWEKWLNSLDLDDLY